jgi:L-ribulose-5-phosphate 3-epimerase
MQAIERRQLLRGAMGVCAAASIATRAVSAQAPQKFRLGLILGISPNPDAAIQRVQELGLPTCQVVVASTSDATVTQLRAALERYKVEATSAVVTGPGREIYDFYQGPETIGLVPRATRAVRIARMKEVADFAQKTGIPAVQGHCGFIPENPNDALYKEAVDAIREVALYCKSKGLQFRCETGQETPITLVRAIRDVGVDNVGVNFDAANLIMYGKANPADAVPLLGPYIQGVHVKDGGYPTDPRKLGLEVPIPNGQANWRLLIRRLHEVNYAGPLTIEREISGEKQTEDVLRSIDYLNEVMG